MEDIERRALMGDRQAQEECTREGTVLPCPFCGKDAELVVIDGLCAVACKDRTCNASDIMPEYAEPMVALSDWNTREPPPIGRCKDCANWDKEHRAGRESLGNYVCVCHEWSDEEDGHMRYTPPDGFCNNFEPREETSNE